MFSIAGINLYFDFWELAAGHALILFDGTPVSDARFLMASLGSVRVLLNDEIKPSGYVHILHLAASRTQQVVLVCVLNCIFHLAVLRVGELLKKMLVQKQYSLLKCIHTLTALQNLKSLVDDATTDALEDPCPFSLESLLTLASYADRERD